MSSINIRSFPRTKFANQDIHTGNILFNHSNSRPMGMGSSGEFDTPIVPFHSTFDFRMAFIDFECAVHFQRGIEPLIRPNMVPPSHTAAPEQLQEGEETYDMFSADVFNLGRTLQIEIEKARVVSIYYLAPLFFTVNVDFYLQKNHRAVTTACQKIRQYDSLLDLMTKEIPSERPTAATAYQLLMAII
jgi:serine/threonine protein kinase